MIKPFRAFSYCLSFRHICSSRPCRIGNAADYQWSIGIMGLSPLRGSLRAAPSKKRRKYHYTRHLHRRKQPHHTAVIALRGSLVPFREVLASEAVLLRRSGKIRSTELFSFQGAVKSDLPLFTIPRTKKQLEDWAPFVQSVVVFGRCHLVESGARATTLLKRFAMKYYPSEQLVDEEIAHAGKAVQIFEIEVEYLSGKEIQER